MINISDTDKNYINRNNGDYNFRGVTDVLTIIENEYGSSKLEEIKKEMEDLGVPIPQKGTVSTVPLSTFVTMLIVSKEVLNLDDESMVKIGTEAAKISFLLKFASQLLISLDMICKNANAGWRKYYKSGELKVTELNKEEKRIIAEIRGFVGHPLYCRFIEGYFSQMIFFVTGKEVDYFEEECIFKGGEVHRYKIEWK